MSLLYCSNCVQVWTDILYAVVFSGEVAFKTLNTGFGWAKRPMMERVGNVDQSVSMTFVHGSQSWIDSRIGYEVKYMRSSSFVDVQVVLLSLLPFLSCE